MSQCPARSIRFDGEEFQLECYLEVRHSGTHYFATIEKTEYYHDVIYQIWWTQGET